MAGESARRGLEPRRLEAHSPGSGGTGAYDLAVREDAGRGNRRRSAIDGERRSPLAFPPGARIAGHRGFPRPDGGSTEKSLSESDFKREVWIAKSIGDL